MDRAYPRCDFLAVQCYGLEARRCSFYFLFLFLLLGFVSINAIAGTDVQNAPVPSVGLGPQFAVADFDGDHVPDLASIQAGLGSSSIGNYWIQLNFSRAERQTIRLIAPAGGLLIEALDVNGDHFSDVVVETASFRQPVAIFLNERGNSFSRLDPAAFPGALGRQDTNWASGSGQREDPESVPLQSRPTCFSETSSLVYRKFSTGTISIWGAGFFPNSFLVSHAGRAPPSEFPRF